LSGKSDNAESEVNNMIYDVIVIGAGPTGSSAARKLAMDGFKVLLVEQFKMPKRQIDSGLLIKKTENLIKSYFKEDVPESVTCSPRTSKGMILTVDDGQEFKYEQPTLNVWRNSFDMWLVEKAIDVGAELRDETVVISCEERENDVIVKLRGKTDYAEKAKVVISCDGAVGTIKKKLTGKDSDKVFVYETFNKGSIDLDVDYFYTYLQPDLAEHSAWFNVKDDYLIFGVAGKDIGKIDYYYSTFINYMKLKHKAHIDITERQERWTMAAPLPGCPINYGKGRVLFAGESAGFMNPISEGLSSAIGGGYAAAEAIFKAGNFDMKLIYAEYKKALAEFEDYMKRQWSLMGSKSSKFAYMK
jgi:flavin-dependent dehydrogenase